MALASYEGARSVTGLSESPVYHYQYSSISKSVRELARDAKERSVVQEEFQKLSYPYYCPVEESTAHVLLHTDSTPVEKIYSPTLANRTYIAIPNNVIPGNKPLSVGYDVSFINLSEPETKWSLPLSVQRVSERETASQRAIAQLNQLFSHPDLGLSQRLVLNSLDCKYGNAAYLAPTFGFENLVNVVRMRSGMKVWTADPRPDTGGAPGVYGEKYYLIDQGGLKTYKKHPKTGLPYDVYRHSVFDLPRQEHFKIEAQTSSGRDIVIELSRWNDLMIRTRAGNNMKDKPFDLLNVKVLDAKSLTGKCLLPFAEKERKKSPLTRDIMLIDTVMILSQPSGLPNKTCSWINTRLPI